MSLVIINLIKFKKSLKIVWNFWLIMYGDSINCGYYLFNGIESFENYYILIKILKRKN